MFKVLIVNSLATQRCGSDFKSIGFKIIIENSSFRTHNEIAPMGMPPNHTNEQLTLVQVMVWCRQAYWPRFMSPHGVTRPQWKMNEYSFTRVGVKPICGLFCLRSAQPMWNNNRGERLSLRLCRAQNVLYMWPARKKRCLTVFPGIKIYITKLRRSRDW